MPRKIHIGPNGGRYINYYGKKKYLSTYLSNLSQFGGDKEDERKQENNRQLYNAQNPVIPPIADEHNLDDPVIFQRPPVVGLGERLGGVPPGHPMREYVLDVAEEAAIRYINTLPAAPATGLFVGGRNLSDAEVQQLGQAFFQNWINRLGVDRAERWNATVRATYMLDRGREPFENERDVPRMG